MCRSGSICFCDVAGLVLEASEAGCLIAESPLVINPRPEAQHVTIACTLQRSCFRWPSCKSQTAKRYSAAPALGPRRHLQLRQVAKSH